MPEAYRTFGSYILFKEILADELGHLYRAAEFDAQGVKRTVWLRVFDAPHVPTRDVIDRINLANQVGEVLQASNVAANPLWSVVGQRPVLATDYLPSHPLSSVLDKVRREGFPVPVDNALLILEKLSLALSAGLTVELQGSPLVHGFLHPGLVVVSNDGEGVVCGFGVADQLLGLLDHKETAEQIVPYIAPEVIMTRTASRRGDVYSLGAILFHLLTGATLPLQPEARTAALDKAELSYDEQPIPQDIKALLTRALAPRPEERFSSAADFKKELDKLLYGGAYSPTTFNLALFMDRLFRSEIEAEERERAEEANVKVEDYLVPEPEPEEREPVAVEATPRRGVGMWVGIATAVVVAAAATAFVLRGRGPTQVAAPTPTPEELAAQRAADEAKIRGEVEKQLQAMLAEREQQIRDELQARQKRIQELEAKLKGAASPAVGAPDSSQATREREQLQQQLEAERRAQEEQERKMREEQDTERQRLLEEARRRRATPVAQPTQPVAAPTQPPARPTEAAVQPTRIAQLEQPTPQPTTVVPIQPAAQPEVIVTQNMFLDPSQVDTLPEVLKPQPVTWPRMALNSRRRGVIIVQATVNASGKVEDVKVLRADADGFGIPQAATEAVHKYMFKPATKNGIKVKSTATVTVPFSFRER